MEYSATPSVPVLQCRQLAKVYGYRPALRGLDLELPEGKIIGLLGPNGSGKTTLIKIIAGLLTPSSGSVTVDGLPIGTETRARVAYLPERNSLPLHMTVAQAVRYFADFFPDFDTARAEDMLTRLGVEPNVRIRHMSKGTKEKVQLVLVMARRARLYLLDEPISGVDPAARDYILDTILSVHASDATIVISTHLIADIENVMDGFVLLKDGQIQSSGTPQGLREHTGKSVDEYFREVFRC